VRCQYRPGAPAARRSFSPRIDLTRIGFEVELHDPRQLRPSTDQDQGLRPAWEIHREVQRELSAERHPHQDRRPRVAAVQYRGHVCCQPRQPGPLPRSWRRVGQPGAATVEQHYARADAKPADQVFECRLLPDHLDMADKRRHQHDRDRPVADNRVGDRRAVVRTRVADLRPKHTHNSSLGSRCAQDRDDQRRCAQDRDDQRIAGRLRDADVRDAHRPEIGPDCVATRAGRRRLKE
jgi:hypothetical protein